jgi:hypothetical protein
VLATSTRTSKRETGAITGTRSTEMHYWQDRSDDKIRLVVVTNEAVYAEEMDAAACARQVGELNAGKSPATVFGKDATHVVLRSVSKVQQTRGDEEIEFSLRDGKDEKSESISIVDDGIRNEVFAALERVTQGRFQHFEDQYSRARAAFGAALSLTIFGFGTKIAASAAAVIRSAEDYEVDGRKKGLKQLIVWVLDLLGPAGVWVIGGSICALLAWSLYSHIKAPPFITILQAEPYKPQSGIITVLKYFGLAAIWVLFFPLLLR